MIGDIPTEATILAGRQVICVTAGLESGTLAGLDVAVAAFRHLNPEVSFEANKTDGDNMAPDVLREAVGIVAGRVTTEASGDINFETVRAVAEAGVDLISVGALTHSVTVFDIGLDTPIT